VILGRCSGTEDGSPEQAGTKVGSRAWEEEVEAFRNRAAVVSPDSGRPQEQVSGGCISIFLHVLDQKELVRQHLRLQMVSADAGEGGRSFWYCMFSFVPPGRLLRDQICLPPLQSSTSGSCST
jgi:hypothetical protein